MKRVDFALAVTAATIAIAPGRASARETAGPAFDFRSNFWVNLHHRLYKTASWSDAKRRGYEVAGSGPALLDTPTLLPSDLRATWIDAVETYRRAFVEGDRDLLFDDGLVAINGKLSESPRDVFPSGLPREIASALRSAAPLYDAYLWSGDDRANRAWIAALEPRILLYGSDMQRRLATIYGTPWPSKPFRVDVTHYGHQFGAYTVTRPAFVHTVAESGDPRLAGLAAVEMMYHEASHAVVFEDVGTIGAEILAFSRRAHHPEPEQFWHAVIFYTAGSVAQQIFRERAIAYRMYADRNGLFSPTVWPHYRAPLQTCWQNYMDRGGDRAAALDRCVRDLPAPQTRG